MTNKLKTPFADFDENPEWTKEKFARAKPFKEVFPEQHASWKKNKGGRSPVESPKAHESPHFLISGWPRFARVL